jgi:hypothetical protein
MLQEPKRLRLLQSGDTLKLIRYIHERGAKVQDQVNVCSDASWNLFAHLLSRHIWQFANAVHILFRMMKYLSKIVGYIKFDPVVTRKRDWLSRPHLLQF